MNETMSSVDVAVVLDTLSRAVSQESSVFKPAEECLKSWENTQGFYSALLAVFSNQSIAVNVRLLAVLYFKNGVDRYWRSTAPHAIPENEKISAKQKLLSVFSEPVSQIATQLAVLIGKIARIDCPRNWPTLIPTLLDGIKSPYDDLSQQRSLLMFYHVIKTLASKRLSADRRLFRDLTKNIFGYIFHLWKTHSVMLDATQLQGLVSPSAKITTELQKNLLLIKILRNLLVYGIEDVPTDESASRFLGSILQMIPTVLEFRLALPGVPALQEIAEKIVCNMMKCLNDVLDNHPFSLATSVQVILELLTTTAFQTSNQRLLFERFTVLCLNLIKSIILCDDYRPARDVGQTKNPLTLLASGQRSQFFSPDTVSGVMQRLVSLYLPLTPDELSQWDESPEEFSFDEGGESWKFNLRSSSEVLFVTIFKEYNDILIPIILTMLKQSQSPPDPANQPLTPLDAILAKDALYNAVGLVAHDLYDVLNFDDWFSNHLLGEIQSNSAPEFKIIRRRVIWLVGEWLQVKFSPQYRPLLYQTLLVFLRPQEDVVIRLTAANTMKHAVDDFEFKVDQFLPFLENSFYSLYQLLLEVCECDSKMQVLNVFSFLIERVGHQIRPYSTMLINYLPSLWEESSEHNMLRCAILSTVVKLVETLGPDSQLLYPFLIPVIQFSTDINQASHIYLLEDGLDLWHVTLQNATSLNLELLQMFANMPLLLDRSSEYLRNCLQIVECYVLLAPVQFLQTYSETLSHTFQNLLSDLKTEGCVLVLRIVETIFKMFHTDGCRMFQNLLPGFLGAILQDKEHPTVMSIYISLFSIIIINSHDVFLQLLQHCSQKANLKTTDVLKMFISQVICKIQGEMITQPERQKMAAMALATMFTYEPEFVQLGTHVYDIMSTLLQVLQDICDPDTHTDTLIWHDKEDGLTPRNSPCEDFESQHDIRRRDLARNDPIHSVPFKDFINRQFSECQQLFGARYFQDLMSTLCQQDTAGGLLNQLHNYL